MKNITIMLACLLFLSWDFSAYAKSNVEEHSKLSSSPRKRSPEFRPLKSHPAKIL